MSPHLTILVATLIGVALGASQEVEVKPLRSCQEFSRGVKFEDAQAVGTWILLRLKTAKSSSIDNTHCMDFIPVNDKERQGLEEMIGKYVENLEWSNLTLKMQIPCARANSTSEHTVVYYLERLGGDGSYRTLQMPSPTAKLDLASFHRYSMRLKLREHLLAMLDCHDRVGFLLGREPDDDQRLQAVLQEIFEG